MAISKNPASTASETAMTPSPRRSIVLALALILLSSSLGAEQVQKPGGQVITIVLAGDAGFSRNHSPVNPTGVHKYGKLQPWRDMTAAIARDINGDLNFVNIETVVTDRNDLIRDTKGQKGPFNFRSHPNGIRHLVDVGFNLFALANNHSMDYGPKGLTETLRHMPALARHWLLAYAGVGRNRAAASAPQIVTAKGARVAFSAIGIVTNNLARHRAGPNTPGQIAYRFPEDFQESTGRLAAARADYRILSIHYGYEGRVRTDAMQIADWRRDAALKKNIDLIVGHHAHVVRGVELAGHSVIFYGLGNFLHHGTANMAGKGICRSYGLLARVHLIRAEGGALRARAIEAIPVTNMHLRTRRYESTAESHRRIHALNYLASRLDNAADGATGVRFTPQADGSGLYCFKGAERDPGKIGALCKGWRPAPPIPASLRGAIARSCAK